MRVPGFVSAQRYRIPGTLNYLAVYEMTSADVLQSEAYARVKNHPSERTARMLREVTGFTRYIAENVTSHGKWVPDAPHLYAVFFDVPAGRQAEFNDWYDQDHAPLLLECRDWLMVRRFRIISGEPKRWTHLALHYLADRKALQSPQRERARASKWRARLAQESWFKPQYLVFDQHGSRQSGISSESSP